MDARFLRNDKGQGLVEYALILVLVAIVVISALMILGPIVGDTFSTISNSLEGFAGVGGGSSGSVWCGADGDMSDCFADGMACTISQECAHGTCGTSNYNPFSHCNPCIDNFSC